MADGMEIEWRRKSQKNTTENREWYSYLARQHKPEREREKQTDLQQGQLKFGANISSKDQIRTAALRGLTLAEVNCRGLVHEHLLQRSKGEKIHPGTGAAYGDGSKTYTPRPRERRV
jgi:hypothetical protein